jgi:uncharacterized CHY-type Zn-finger protein
MADTTELPTIICQECEAEFTILHGEFDQPSFCPFCASELENIEPLDDEDEDYFYDEE